MDLTKSDTSLRPFTSAKSHRTAIANDVAFSIGQCALGKVLVGRSPVGVRAILIGSESEELTSDLAARFPDSKLISNALRLRNDLLKVVRFIKTPSQGLDLVLGHAWYAVPAPWMGRSPRDPGRNHDDLF